MPLTTRFFFVSAANRIGPFVTPADLCHPEAIRRGSQKDLNVGFNRGASSVEVLRSAQDDNKKQERKRQKFKGNGTKQQHTGNSVSATA
jgi:hypothetical protein